MAVRLGCIPGMVSLLSEIEKPPQGRLFLFLLYKFRISHWENKPAKTL
jgi:hypothetical protein